MLNRFERDRKERGYPRRGAIIQKANDIYRAIVPYIPKHIEALRDAKSYRDKSTLLEAMAKDAGMVIEKQYPLNDVVRIVFTHIEYNILHNFTENKHDK